MVLLQNSPPLRGVIGLGKKEGPAMYGYESELKPASELFSSKDAEDALTAARETLTLCRRLINELFAR